MKIVIRNVKTNQYRMVPVEVRFKKDRVKVVKAFDKSLPSNEEIVELHLDKQGK